MGKRKRVKDLQSRRGAIQFGVPDIFSLMISPENGPTVPLLWMIKGPEGPEPWDWRQGQAEELTVCVAQRCP